MNKIIWIEHDKENKQIVINIDDYERITQQISLNVKDALFVMENIIGFVNKEINEENS